MRRWIVAVLLVLCCSFLFSQEVSERKEIAIFKLSHYDHEITDSALGSIDEELKAVFINLGRFDVIGMAYRLSQNDVNDFTEKVKEFKGENVEIPEEFQMGREIFTEKDMNQLIGAFYVIIPAVTHFSIVQEQVKLASGKTKIEYDVELKTSFTFINVAEAKPFAQFFIESSGSSDEAADRAVQSAVDSIPAKLEFEITKIPEFTLKTGVLERKGAEVIIELGQDMGIRPGYEFTILESRVLDSGKVFQSESGLLIVKEVGQEVSLTTLLIGNAREGDQLKEIPRMGFEVHPYFDGLLNPIGGFSFAGVGGVRITGAKGFYAFRPLGGLEIPIPMLMPKDSLVPLMWAFGFPFNVYVGGERVFYLRRIQIAPQAAIGGGFLIPWLIETEDPLFTHLGGWVNANVSYLLNRDTKIFIDFGYKQWIGIYDGLFEVLGLGNNLTSYGGIMIGGGITRKL